MFSPENERGRRERGRNERGRNDATHPPLDALADIACRDLDHVSNEISHRKIR
jgi:hypothetical protein